MKRITREQLTNVFGPDEIPVAEVEPGEQVLFETLDALGGRVKTHADALSVQIPHELGNPATGPVRVVGAQPGDVLVVEIIDIRLGKFGFGRVKGGGVILDELNPPSANLTPIIDGVVHFNDHIQFPVRPMVGVIGTAPSKTAVHSFFPGKHGGNLDINEIKVGSKVYLPVMVPGALLSIGDVHASMGDGELNGGGLDIDAEVIVKVDLCQGLGWSRPIIETESAWCVCANAPTLPEAIRIATSEMTSLLSIRLQMSREEAFILIGAAGDARIGQAAGLDMDCTAYVRIPKGIMPKAF